MKIDWSKAPEWAGAVIADSYGRKFYVEQFGGISIRQPLDGLYDNGRANMMDPHHWALVESRLAPTWTGEGLPPVGTVCLLAGETLTLKPIHPDWAGAEVKVYAHFETDQGRKLAAYVSEDHMKGGVGVAELFRPKLTAEQIAAQQREALELEACTEIEPKLDGYNVDLDCSTAIRMTIHAMIEAGYRKQVQL